MEEVVDSFARERAEGERFPNKMGIGRKSSTKAKGIRDVNP